MTENKTKQSKLTVSLALLSPIRDVKDENHKEEKSFNLVREISAVDP